MIWRMYHSLVRPPSRSTIREDRASVLVGAKSGRVAVVADGFNGTLFQGGEARRLFGRVLRLAHDEAVPVFVLADEVEWGRLTAEVAVDAGGVDVEATGDVLGDLLALVGHWRRTTRA